MLVIAVRCAHAPVSHRRSHRDVVTPHEQAALEALHAHLPLLSPTQLAQAVYVAGLMRVRPYKSWMTMACQQVWVLGEGEG